MKKTMGEATTFPLRWLLDEEHLQLVGVVTGLKPVRGTRRRDAKFPQTEAESLHLSSLRGERAKLGKKVIPHLSTECDMTQTAPPQ